ncbi:BnaC09g14520D [Brassica napus]|uniref:BnaC09g14520D protein n=1 Tax=Brassica napus TaxID=3708 RepID=A0A078HT88_BRANA|nr:BnaC09g14520D [Brassica napus]
MVLVYSSGEKIHATVKLIWCPILKQF